MSRLDVINNINKLNRRIDEHKDKIRKNPGDRTIPHWQSEIKEFERQKERLERELNVMQSRMYCPNCRREVSLNGSKCGICRLVIDS
ncbi:hypothetical protein [Hydrogenophaga sp. RWCD_12]|uniref:hypothetical protein n=1 Tax=Hydrogenophaga sp. RWCD_12 TaxID=3391190 RepID=UPI00398548E1